MGHDMADSVDAPVSWPDVTIRTITFDTHWYQETYDAGQVDALLDRLAASLAPPPRHAGRGAVA